MKLVKIIILLIFIFVLGCTGCISNSSNQIVEDEIAVEAITGPDYRNQGMISYDSIEGKLTSSAGCEVGYTYFRPGKVFKDVMVILGHGFMRSKGRMIDLARHLASWGISVVTVEFCNSKLWAGNHDLNGADMVAVARKLNADKVIYSGFSAGGLAALAAAGLDKNTTALFGLDMVDNKGLGKKIAPELTIPLYGLIAAPSICNADNNGLQSYKAASCSRVIEVEDATHCHFEFPFDGKCSIACGKGEKRFKREVIQKTILGFTTAFLLWQTGIDINGEVWWSDGSKNINILTEAGYVKTLIPQSN
jgi:dienelactone hydrolase